jgi:hypothetical protein
MDGISARISTSMHHWRQPELWTTKDWVNLFVAVIGVLGTLAGLVVAIYVGIHSPGSGSTPPNPSPTVATAPPAAAAAAGAEPAPPASAAVSPAITRVPGALVEAPNTALWVDPVRKIDCQKKGNPCYMNNKGYRPLAVRNQWR